MATSARRWRSVLHAAARASASQRANSTLRHSTGLSSHAAPQSRSFSVQIQSQSAASSPIKLLASDDVTTFSAPPPTHHLCGKTMIDAPLPLSVRSCEHVLRAPDSSFRDALRSFTYLLEHKQSLKERHFLAMLEKANVAQQYGTVREIFNQFCAALEQNRVGGFPVAKRTWTYYQSQQLQMHRHVLWALLQGPATTRFRAMQRHFRRHELATKRNRLELYESDSLNFLLRMECTFTFVDPQSSLQVHESWLDRVATILNELRALRFRTNYSSSHALFHFLMHRPDIALGVRPDPEATEPATATVDDQQIFRVLTTLMDDYPRTLERDPRRMSLAVSTAASAGRVGLAVELLHDAETRSVPVDAASFAHVVAMAKDEEMRLAIAGLYMRAKEKDRIYEDEDNSSMKNFLLLYAVHDGNFTQIMELLHQMEFHKIQATPRTVTMLFASIAEYRGKIRQQFHEKESSELDAALKECPSVLQLMSNFPTVIDRNTHTGSQAILQALRGGDIDVARSVLRTTVQATKAQLRAEVFSQVLYALLASDPTSERDVMPVREVEKLFDQQHPGKRAHLLSQLLNLCESDNNLETMLYVLDHWAATSSEPLSKRALQRVFDVVSKHLKVIQKQGAQTAESEEGSDVRYKVGSTDLSFCGILVRYPTLVPLNRWTLNNAVMRSATARLTDDVTALLHVVHSKGLAIDTIGYKAALDVLRTAAQQDSEPSASVAVCECVAAMKANGSWSVLYEQHADFAASVETK